MRDVEYSQSGASRRKCQYRPRRGKHFQERRSSSSGRASDISDDKGSVSRRKPGARDFRRSGPRYDSSSPKTFFRIMRPRSRVRSPSRTPVMHHEHSNFPLKCRTPESHRRSPSESSGSEHSSRKSNRSCFLSRSSGRSHILDDKQSISCRRSGPSRSRTPLSRSCSSRSPSLAYLSSPSSSVSLSSSGSESTSDQISSCQNSDCSAGYKSDVSSPSRRNRTRKYI